MRNDQRTITYTYIIMGIRSRKLHSLYAVHILKMHYLEIYAMQSRFSKCSVNQANMSFYRVNAIWEGLYRMATKEVVIQLIKCKRLSICIV